MFSIYIQLCQLNRIRKSSHVCQNSCLFTHISTLQAGCSEIWQIAFFKEVIKSIHIMALNIAMTTRTLGFVWAFYRGLHMLTGLLPEKSYRKSSYITRLSNMWQATSCSTSLTRKIVVVIFIWRFLQSKQFWGKCACPVTFAYCTIKNGHNQSGFVNSFVYTCQKSLKWTLKK